MGNIMWGIILFCAVGIFLCVPSVIIWLVTELPRKIREWREFREFKKSHSLYWDVHKSWVKKFYV